jgi:hypothetical protein
MKSLEQMIFGGQGSKWLKDWSHPPESNRRPTDYESVALPTELGWHPNKIADLVWFVVS